MDVVVIEKNTTNVVEVSEKEIVVVEKGIKIIETGRSSAEWGGIEGTLNNQIDLKNALDLKVNVEIGKGLSTEDYTTTEKNKLGVISGTNTGDETQSSINSKIGYTPANDSNVVHNTGDETINGLKYFKTNIMFDWGIRSRNNAFEFGYHNGVLNTGTFLIGNNVTKAVRLSPLGNATSLTAPQGTLNIDNGNAIKSEIKFSAGTTTGSTATDGFDIGITGTGVAQIKQLENLNLEFYTNSVKVGDVSNTGVWANNSGTWSTLSDERLKENINPVTDALEKCLLLAKCVRHYNFKNQTKYATGKRTGYIAQLLRDNGFEGHVTYNKPVDEEEGVLLGWEYADELYKELEGEEEVEKTRRVIVKEGEMILGIENNFVPYVFGAIEQLNNRLKALEEKLGV